MDYNGNRESGKILGISGGKIVGLDFERAHGLDRIFKIVPTERQPFLDDQRINGCYRYQTDQFDECGSGPLATEVFAEQIVQSRYGMGGDKASDLARVDQRKQGR